LYRSKTPAGSCPFRLRFAVRWRFPARAASTATRAARTPPVRTQGMRGQRRGARAGRQPRRPHAPVRAVPKSPQDAGPPGASAARAKRRPPAVETRCPLAANPVEPDSGTSPDSSALGLRRFRELDQGTLSAERRGTKRSEGKGARAASGHPSGERSSRATCPCFLLCAGDCSSDSAHSSFLRRSRVSGSRALRCAVQEPQDRST